MIEIAVGLAIMTIVAIGRVPVFMNQINEGRTNKLVVDTQAVLDAA